MSTARAFLYTIVPAGLAEDFGGAVDLIRRSLAATSEGDPRIVVDRLSDAFGVVQVSLTVRDTKDRWRASRLAEEAITAATRKLRTWELSGEASSLPPHDHRGAAWRAQTSSPSP